jgi:diguanylate cyclase (GGDEF)-like protein
MICARPLSMWRWVVAPTIIAVAAVSAIAATIWQLRRDAIDDAIWHVADIASVLGKQLGHSVQLINLVLDQQIADFERFDLATPERMRAFVGTQSYFNRMRERLTHMPQAFNIGIADRDGQLLAATAAWPAPALNIADRDYFRQVRDAADDRLFISGPVTGRLDGTTTIIFGRRILDPNKVFAGATFVSVTLDHFEALGVGVLRDQTFALMRDDGTVLIRNPPLPGVEKIPPRSQWYQVAHAGGGVFQATDPVQGGARWIIAHPVPSFPLVINVGISESAALEKWSKRALFIAAGTLITVSAGFLLLGGMRRQFDELAASRSQLDRQAQEIREQSNAMERASSHFSTALANLPVGLSMFDRDQRLVVCNENYRAIYGLSPDLVKPGCSFREILRHRESLHQTIANSDTFIEALYSKLTSGGVVTTPLRLSDGRAISVVSRPMAGGGWVAIHEDVTEKQRAEKKIAYMAHYDHLTGLANRTLFLRKIKDWLTWICRSPGAFAILMIDLDRFKDVNDTLGHPAGDLLLKEVAQRLKSCTREMDVVARLGGDEFAIIQVLDGPDHSASIILASRIIEAVGAPYLLDGHEASIGTSIGIAIAPEHGSDPDQLVAQADFALYKVKAEGRNGYRLFDQALHGESYSRRILETDLRNALANDEFQILYQPIVSLATGRVTGAEALLRWHHPRQGLIAPDHFIPMAEETGLIVAIGEWVLRKACADAATWPEDTKLAVNLSPTQFKRGHLFDVVLYSLVESGLAPSRLELEIVESVLLKHTSENITTMHQLRELGVGISLDDFGIGYSSLSYIHQFPFDKIKIDKSFVRELTTSSTSAAVICTVSALAKGLNIRTLAEGIERAEQHELLRLAGCDEGQGYLFGAPVELSNLDFKRGEPGAKTAAA